MIRDIKAQDKEGLFLMLKDFYNNTGACLHGMNEENCNTTFEYCLKKNPYVRIVMMEDGGKTVGFGMLSFTWSNEAGGLVVLLEELYFKPEYRGRGYGKQFFQWVEAEYAHAKRFRLEVTHTNEGAIRLYRAKGYERLDYMQMIKDVD